MLQDRRGFMWFGTADGLNRYDGYSFKVYNYNPEDTNSLSGSVTNALYEDRSGMIWIGTTTNGLNKFDPTTGQFTRYQHQDNDPQSLVDDYVSAICEDRAGNLWVGSGTGGLNQLDRKTGKVRRYQHQPGNPQSLSNNHVVSVYEDRAGTLWIGTSRNGLNKFNPKTGTFTRYGNAATATEGLTQNSAFAIYEDRKGGFWVGGIGGVMHQFDRKTGTFKRFDAQSAGPNAADAFNVIRSISEDRFGKLWLATINNGLLQFDPTTGQYTHYENKPGEPGSIGDNTVTCTYTDCSGVVWVGTYSAGVQKVDQLVSRFSHYQKQTHGLSSNSITSLWASRTGALWIGTVDGGVNKLDLQSGKTTLYQHQPGNAASLSSNTIHSVYEDSQGAVWVGTFTSGLDQLDPATGRITHYPHTVSDTLDNGDNIIINTYEDKQGNFWVLSSAGLSKLDRAAGTFRYYPDASEAALLTDNETGYLLEDRSGVLWVGGDVGLAQLDRDKGTFTPYKSRKKNAAITAVDASVHTLYEDRAGKLWIGTSDGLYCLNRQTDTFIQYGKKNGLTDELILGITEDTHGAIWINTSLGLSKLDPRTGKFRNYDSEDGLLSEEYTSEPSLLQTGQVVLGGVNGLDVFRPDSLRDNTHLPPVVLTDFQVFNQSVPVRAGSAATHQELTLPRPVDALTEITLPYDKNVFSFTFAALDFTRPAKNQYAYRMEGFEPNWMQAGTRRFVTYTNLDPGTYTFRVKAANNDGRWNEKGLAVRVTILPPWWRTAWAYGLYALLGAGVLYLFRQYTVNRERLKADLRVQRLESQKLQEIDQLKTTFFTNLSHEFRTPLTLILGPLEQKLAAMTKDHPETNDFRIMQRNARRLLELINQLLDLSRLDAGRLRLQAQYGDLVPFVRTTAAAFETLSQQRLVELVVNFGQPEIRAYFDHDKLEKIMYNLLSNAFKFTPEGGVISVRVFLVEADREALKDQARQVVIEVEDSGNGIAADQLPHIFDRFYQADSSATSEGEGSGIGLALTRELVRLHSGTITASSRLGEGTRFAISLPLGKAHLREEQIVHKLPVAAPGLSLKPPLLPTPKDETPANGTAPVDAELPLVLLVEDNPDMRQYLKSSLGVGYRLVEATNGEEGLTLAAQLVPDLIISDVMMPKLDGMELVRRLKTDQHTSHVPVILLTARAGRESKLSGLETGADDYLVKPFDAEELRVRAKNLIVQRQKLRERFKDVIQVQPNDAAEPSADDRFLQRAVAVAEANLSNSDFDVVAFSREIGMSQSQLYRKLVALTGYNSSEFIRRLRLQRAAALLAAGQGNVTEVSYATGFNNLSYFSKCFRELYGLSPSEYATQAVKA